MAVPQEYAPRVRTLIATALADNAGGAFTTPKIVCVDTKVSGVMTKPTTAVSHLS